MLQDTDYYSYLSCPFTGRKLRFLSEQELENVNERIGRRELYFHPGILVSTKLTRALVTEHQSYIYPVFDNIFYLKRETAIVAKNRTENYLKRVSQNVIDDFESRYELNTVNEQVVTSSSKKLEMLSPDRVTSLRANYPKTGENFVSICANDIDAIYNLVFETRYKRYIHVEFDLRKLKSIEAELKENTVLILADNGKLPFEDGAIDAMFSFDPINKYAKADQKFIYDDFKRVLKPGALSTVLFENDKPLHAKLLSGVDKLSKTARSVVMPWKRSKLAKIDFQGVKPAPIESQSDEIVSKTSLGRQFS
ncbi:hypothetical protein BFP97_05320 [Roseivirga sp. 4D4]|uniref:class I SAM-dependent methyltransferase n=1 Tax=Roseivirga sp. 4D4 TaxID=1889784 RepID=UPI0008536E7F|nr:class I SAM-dependent methyltransferase [Roseivirga sp. 4D4]OEK00964.1 hypothetical protein BFP97_05320 [Roseivirga sp. 4D4]